jgi:hypothetical protein
MTITEAVTAVYLKAVGKATAPTSGTSKYDRIIGLLDFYQRRWGREKGVDWNSLYDPALSIGTVTATDSFDLDTSTVRKLSDREGDVVRIVWSDGVSYTDYDIVSADTLKNYYYGPGKTSSKGFVCARIGNQLVFNHTFTTDDAQYGGDIQVPCYTFPDAITDDSPNTDEVQVDDPDWLVLICAAEYVRNDITRRQRYPELLAEANEAMERMRDDNEAQINVINRPWTAPGGVGQENAWS